jgi:hypothetical protein
LYAVMHVLKVIEAGRNVDRMPLLFVHGNARAKSNRSREVRRSGAPCFLYAAILVLKVIGETYADWELIAFYT